MRHPLSLFATGLLTIAIISSCDEQSLRNGDEVTNIEVDSTKSTIIGVSGQLFSIPSPIQTALLIKAAKVPYNEKALPDASTADQYIGKAQQAMNLGVQGVAMAYSSLYDDGQRALRYYKAVDKLAHEIGISAAIDGNLVQRLAANVGNADSLLVLSGRFYREADIYLKENDRADIASYVLLGGWVEATYLTALAANEGTQASRIRLAEQKETIKTICEVLETTADDEFKSSELFTLLKALNTTYLDVVKTYTYAQPEVVPEKKTTIIKSSSTYSMSDEQLDTITELIIALRKNIIR
jgi:hypothetical protein